MTSPIGESELAGLRAAVDQWLTDDAQLQRVTRTPNAGTFGYANTPTIVWTGKVRRKPVSESRGAVVESDIADRTTTTSYWLFTFPAGVVVESSDRILSAGRTYEVIGQGLDKSLEIARYVVAREGT